MKIFIVEDQEQDRYLLETILRNSGHEVASAANGLQALDGLSAGDFDLIVSDVLMPVMDGFQLCLECTKSEELRQIPFVFYTGTYTDRKDRELAIEMGAAAFLIKPMNPHRLVQALEQVPAKAREKKPGPVTAPAEADRQLLKLYDERLVNKLEKKMLQLENEVSRRRRAEEALKGQMHDLDERAKEIACLYRVSELLSQPSVSFQELLHRIVYAIPPAMQYPEAACARINLDDGEWKTRGYAPGKHKLSAEISVYGRRAGSVELCYTEEKPQTGEPVFLKEESSMIEEVARRVGEAVERRNEEEALRESEQFNATLLGHSPNPILVVNLDSSIRYVNPAFERLTGFPAEEVLGGTVPYPWWSEETAYRAREDLDQAMRDGVAKIEDSYRNRDGERLVVEIAYSMVKVDGRTRYYLANWADITGRKETEEALRRSERELEIRRGIAGIFLTVPDEDVYGRVLPTVLRALKSRYGVFGYLDEDGALVCSDMTADVWDECRLPDKRTTFPRESWGGIWGRALTERKTLLANTGLTTPEGHIAMQRALDVPIIFQEEVIGNLLVANKETDYDEEDRELLETIAQDIAPVLKARLQSERYARERSKADLRLRASLAEKEALIDEVHHRVKNNMQVISSLLNLQARQIEDEAAIEALKRSQDRIRSMALVHEKLYYSTDLSRIDFGDYIRDLVSRLLAFYGVDRHAIGTEVDCEDVFLGITTAVPCGLIVNELVSNSVKHAFPDGRKGEIGVTMRLHEEETFSLVVSDNGVGLPASIDPLKPSSLGLELVATLVKQIGGTMELNRQRGTTVTITFTERGFGTQRRGPEEAQQSQAQPEPR